MNLSAADMLLISAILAASGLVQGFSGFGYGIVAMALLALLPHAMAPMAAIVAITALVVLLALLAISHHQGRVQWRQGGLLFLGGLLGTMLGYGFISLFGDQPIFRLALATYLILAGLNGWRSKPGGHPHSKAAAIPVGVFAGFLSGAFVSGGPPILFYLYGKVEDPRSMKATVQMVFIIMLVYRMAMMAFDPSLREPTIWVFAALACIPALAALFMGHWLSRRISPKTFTRTVCGGIILLGILTGWNAV